MHANMPGVKFHETSDQILNISCQYGNAMVMSHITQQHAIQKSFSSGVPKWQKKRFIL